MSFAVLRVTGSTQTLSWVLAIQIVPSLVFTLAGGVFADRLPPQRVILAGNLMMAVGEGVFGLLVLAGRPQAWEMMALEALTGSGLAMIYPAQEAMLPQLVPDNFLTQAKVLSRLTMNGAQMAGAAVGGLVTAAVGPGIALVLASGALIVTLPALVRIGRYRLPSLAPPDGQADQPGGGAEQEPGIIRSLREGWDEFRTRTWVWAIVAEFGLVMASWYGSFQVLGPVAAQDRLGGAAAWGAITGSVAAGLIVGGAASLRYAPRRPIRFVALAGAIMALTPLALAAGLPLPLVCVCGVLSGMADEMLMVQWTLALTRNIPRAALARVASYDALGSIGAMPVGAVLAGPAATAWGVSATQYGAVLIMVLAACAALISREVRTTGASPMAVESIRAALDALPAANGKH